MLINHIKFSTRVGCKGLCELEPTRFDALGALHTSNLALLSTHLHTLLRYSMQEASYGRWQDRKPLGKGGRPCTTPYGMLDLMVSDV